MTDNLASKQIALFPFLMILLLAATVTAVPLRITSGQLFVGGTSYGTTNYQTYLAFSLNSQNRMPQKAYVFYGEQIFSVYQNHPIHPEGDFEFIVKMPYSPDGISINGEVFQPVWYSDSRWTIRSFLVVPVATEVSPKYIDLKAPFRMNGYFAVYGARKVHDKCSGYGTAVLKFEKIGSRYFFLEARYNFGPVSAAKPEN